MVSIVKRVEDGVWIESKRLNTDLAELQNLKRKYKIYIFFRKHLNTLNNTSEY